VEITSKHIRINTKGEGDSVEITQKVSEALSETRLKNGIINIFVMGSTGALTTIEYEPGLLKDLPIILERLAPKNLVYEHNNRWHDGNGHSHIRASVIGPSITIPFINGKLTLGTWQQIIFIELDIRRRTRNLVLQIMGI
jgi:secondary thiamine-phosphate synthase enzyme